MNQPTQNSNTPAILSAAGVALAANPARKAFSVTNLGTNPLFVLLGTGASTSVFHYILKGSTVDSDGTGGVLTFSDGIIFDGVVSVAGTSPKFVVLEIAP